MPNPFVYGEVVPGEAFVDREVELDRLIGDLAGGQKVFLISPRRYGKSSLVRQALDGLARRGALTVEVTVSSFSSAGPGTGGASVTTGWASAECTGPIKASLLFRFYDHGVPVGEAGVNAMTSPSSSFITFAQTQTGVAYANPSAQAAIVTITALNSAGQVLASRDLTLSPGEHGAAFVGPLLGLSSFTGSVRITSSTPIVSLSLNFEAAPVFSSLPPGQ
jgi:hypothetical protein